MPFLGHLFCTLALADEAASRSDACSLCQLRRTAKRIFNIARSSFSLKFLYTDSEAEPVPVTGGFLRPRSPSGTAPAAQPKRTSLGLALGVITFLGSPLGISAEFRPEIITDSVPCSTLPELASDAQLDSLSGVNYSCQALVYRDAAFEVWKHGLRFEFGKLSEDDYKVLRKMYAAPWLPINYSEQESDFQSPSLVPPYDPDKTDFCLMDFLPLPMRSLVDWNFVEEDEALPGGADPGGPFPRPPTSPASPDNPFHLYKDTILVPNCWSTVWELLRFMAGTRLGAGDSEPGSTKLSGQQLGDSPTQTIPWSVYSTDDLKMQAALKRFTRRLNTSDFQFGDVLLIFNEDTAFVRPVLEHAVLFLDRRILFEKAGTGKLNPYRVVDLSTVMREWPPSNLGEKKGLFQYHAHRLKSWTDVRLLEQLSRESDFVQEFSLDGRASELEKADPRWSMLWQWPEAYRRQYTLAVGDNPRSKTGEVDEITLLRAKTYELGCRGKKDGSESAESEGRPRPRSSSEDGRAAETIQV